LLVGDGGGGDSSTPGGEGGGGDIEEMVDNATTVVPVQIVVAVGAHFWRTTMTSWLVVGLA
jgi:hypothetical protein